MSTLHDPDESGRYLLGKTVFRMEYTDLSELKVAFIRKTEKVGGGWFVEMVNCYLPDTDRNQPFSMRYPAHGTLTKSELEDWCNKLKDFPEIGSAVNTD